MRSRPFDEYYATPADDDEFWTPMPGNPLGPTTLFDDTIYIRGAMVIQALRETVGERAFFRILRTWTRENRHANATVSDFIALSESVSRMDLEPFFEAWLFEPEKPPEEFAG